MQICQHPQHQLTLYHRECFLQKRFQENQVHVEWRRDLRACRDFCMEWRGTEGCIVCNIYIYICILNMNDDEAQYSVYPPHRSRSAAVGFSLTSYQRKPAYEYIHDNI